MKKLLAAIACAALMMSPATARQWKIVEPLAADVVDHVHVVGVEIAATGRAAEMVAHFDAKAAEKAAAANAAPGAPPAPTPAPAAASAGPDAAAPVAESRYATLPFAEMAPLVFADVTKDWGLTEGRAIKLKITVDTLKTASAGMALLGGSSDQLAGMVEVLDAETGTALGSFYVDVRNSHGGLLGLAMRGAGIREKLMEEFALESSRVLTGRNSRTRRA